MLKLIKTLYDRHLRKWVIRHNRALYLFPTIQDEFEWVKNGTGKKLVDLDHKLAQEPQKRGRK